MARFLSLALLASLFSGLFINDSRADPRAFRCDDGIGPFTIQVSVLDQQTISVDSIDRRVRTLVLTRRDEAGWSFAGGQGNVYNMFFNPAQTRVSLNKPNSETIECQLVAAPRVSPNGSRMQLRAGSWGGIVRQGPGSDFPRLDSLREGEPVTLTERTNVIFGGYPWFRVSYRGGQTGYKWGGILCGLNDNVEGLAGICNANAQAPAPRAPRIVGCEEGQIMDGGRCRDRTVRDAPGRCPPGTVPVPQTDNCVWATDRNGFEINPERKPQCPGLKAQCARGNARACGDYEATCQVN